MKILLSQIRLPEKDLRASIDLDALEELADSMRDRGQKQAIGIRLLAPDDYEVVYGSRRYRAAKLNGWDDINAEILDNCDEENTAADKLIENVQREALTPIEEAYGLYALIGDGEADIRLLQRQTGKNRQWIKGRLELLDLPEDIQGAIQKNLVTVGVGKALGSIDSEQVRTSYLRYAIDNGCTTETAVSWANQAEFAEVGILSMQQSEAAVRQMQEQSEVVEQKWNCFSCHNPYTFRQISMYTLCRGCSETVNPQRDKPHDPANAELAAPQATMSQ